MDETKPSFDALLMESISESLTQVLGETGAKCVLFFVDPHLAVADPDNFARALLGLFGTATKALLDTTLANLYQKTGVARSSATSFGQIVADARLNFRQGDQIKET